MKVIGKTQQSRKCTTTKLHEERNALDSSRPRLLVELVDEGTQREIDPWNRIGDDFRWKESEMETRERHPRDLCNSLFLSSIRF